MDFFFAFEPRNYVYKDWTPDLDCRTPESKERQYIWEVYSDPPVDGVLVSRAKLSKPKEKEVLERGIHSYLRYDGPIFGDCGAFSYVKKSEPPYNPLKVLAYYYEAGFDYGATVDHLIVKAVYHQKERRYKITQKNAEIMYKKWQSGYRNGLNLMGVAQGWDVESYCQAVKNLIEIGYDHIALGSLARRPTQFIRRLLQTVDRILRDSGLRPKLHLFGLGRTELFPDMELFGVTSFDTATVLRQAWLRFKQGYHLDGETYAAIRVRPEESSGREILQLIRSYDGGEAEFSTVVEALRKIEPSPELIPMYERTLRKKPWTRCPCSLCKTFGVDVIVFRGNERNMRRGFHNVWHFHRTLRRALRDRQPDVEQR